MPEERHQFRILYRDFLRRVIDLDVLSSHGDMEKLLVQFAAMLAAFNFSFLIFAGPKYLSGAVPEAQLRIAVRSEFEFLVASTMAVAGLFAVLAWNNVLPDRRDSLILGLLPVRTRTVFLAKIAAIASALGVAIVALNIFTGLLFPFLALPEGAGWMAALQAFAGYWLAMAAAGLFVCCGMLALQGLAAQLLPYRYFLRVSSFLQLAAFFGILAAYFLKPPGAVPWLPSSWFFGLQQQLSGAVPFHPLAARALWMLLGVSSVAAITFALAYGPSVRKIVEQPDILPGSRPRRAPRLSYAILRRPVDRAIVLFTARTIARSRQHRLLLAAYGGIGLAIAFAYGRDLLYGPSDIYARRLGTHWNQLNVPLLMGGLVLLCFAVAGARAIFSLPVSLGSNWIFRLTAVHPPGSYFSGVRKALFAVTVLPVWLACAGGYFLIWPARPAAQHMLVLAIAAVFLVHRFLDQFRKIPFACSYLPGKSNLHVKLGIYGLAFLAIASFSVQIEYFAMPHPWFASRSFAGCWRWQPPGPGAAGGSSPGRLTTGSSSKTSRRRTSKRSTCTIRLPSRRPARRFPWRPASPSARVRSSTWSRHSKRLRPCPSACDSSISSPISAPASASFAAPPASAPPPSRSWPSESAAIRPSTPSSTAFSTSPRPVCAPTTSSTSQPRYPAIPMAMW